MMFEPRHDGSLPVDSDETKVASPNRSRRVFLRVRELWIEQIEPADRFLRLNGLNRERARRKGKKQKQEAAFGERVQMTRFSNFDVVVQTKKARRFRDAPFAK